MKNLILSHLTVLFFVGCSHTNNEPQMVEKSETVITPINRSQISDMAYRKWFDQNANKVPDHKDRMILRSYVHFLTTQNHNDAKKMVQQLQSYSTKKGSRLSNEWLSLFAGPYQLIHNNQSLGTLTLKNLIPLLEKGNSSAIELLMVYSAAVASDGLDSESLTEYSQFISKKYPQKVNATLKKNARYFKNFPPLVF